AWDSAKAALLSLPLGGGVRVGLRIAVAELVFDKDGDTEAFSLATNTDAEVAEWLDRKLARENLQPASGTPLPYETPAANFVRAVDEGPRLAALSAWFAAGAEVLDELRHQYKRYRPGPSLCWPHHFDLAMVLEVGWGARSIGIGLSPGDDYYAQPYFYLRPSPKPGKENLPPLPPAGRWHTREFFGAVATGVELLALPNPRAGLHRVLETAFEESLRRLDG
ncbi:MAG: hypothetical protein ACREVD_12155, partial [Burkholderiales bacterium]